jgi:hypothetical protein
MKLSPALAVPALMALSLSLSAQDAWFEDFDARGDSWSTTLFPDVILAPSTGLTREPLTAALGAPETEPPLPINADGDAEGRVFEIAVPASHAFALTADTPAFEFRDGGIRLQAAFGVRSSFGSQSFGALLRASVDPSAPSGSGLQAYGALVLRTRAAHVDAGTVYIARWRDGVAQEILADGTFTMNPSTENYRLEFHALGTRLTARLWRTTAGGGRLWVTPILLEGGTGQLGNELVAHDGEQRAGRAGLDAFTRSTNSIFLDDVLVKAQRGERNAAPAAAGILVPAWPPLPWTATSPWIGTGRVDPAPRSHAPVW